MQAVINVKMREMADNIRKMREYRNYTQEYVAARLGISQNAYSKIELGYTKITVERLCWIALVLEMEMRHLLDIIPVAS